MQEGKESQSISLINFLINLPWPRLQLLQGDWPLAPLCYSSLEVVATSCFLAYLTIICLNVSISPSFGLLSNQLL